MLKKTSYCLPIICVVSFISPRSRRGAGFTALSFGFLMILISVLSIASDAKASSKDLKPVGRIVSRTHCSPPPQGYIIKPDIQAGISTVRPDAIQLYEGDSIEIKEPLCRLTIAINSKEKTLDRSDPHYRVPVTRQYSTVERILASLQDVIGGRGQGISQGHSRGEDDQELLLPLLDWDSKISAGSRTLSIPWNGGEGPFEVSVTTKGDDKHPLTHAANVSTRSITFKGVSLRPGRYTVTVSGKGGDSARAHFMVVNANEIPQMPKSINTANTGGYPSELLSAWWLSSSGNGEFVFEAYQQIASLDNPTKEISRLKAFFEQGGRLRLD